MNSTSQQPTRITPDRSRDVRATIKKYYIYVVLLFIVFVFSVVKLGEVETVSYTHLTLPTSDLV